MRSISVRKRCMHAVVSANKRQRRIFSSPARFVQAGVGDLIVGYFEPAFGTFYRRHSLWGSDSFGTRLLLKAAFQPFIAVKRVSEKSLFIYATKIKRYQSKRSPTEKTPGSPCFPCNSVSGTVCHEYVSRETMLLKSLTH